MRSINFLFTVLLIPLVCDLANAEQDKQILLILTRGSENPQELEKRLNERFKGKEILTISVGMSRYGPCFACEYVKNEKGSHAKVFRAADTEFERRTQEKIDTWVNGLPKKKISATVGFIAHGFAIVVVYRQEQ